MFDRYCVCFLFRFLLLPLFSCIHIHDVYLFLATEFSSYSQRNVHLVSSFWIKIQCDEPVRDCDQFDCFVETRDKRQITFFHFYNWKENVMKWLKYESKGQIQMADHCQWQQNSLLFFSHFLSFFSLPIVLLFYCFVLCLFSISRYCALSPVSFHLSIVIVACSASDNPLLFSFFFSILLSVWICHFHRENGCLYILACSIILEWLFVSFFSRCSALSCRSFSGSTL